MDANDQQTLMADATKAIELWPCGYDAQCEVRNCKAKATMVALCG